MDRKDFWEAIGVEDIRSLELIELMKKVILSAVGSNDHVTISKVIDNLEKEKISEREKLAVSMMAGINIGRQQSCDYGCKGEG